MITTQSVVVPDPLWMMHVIGPDDIYPAPDHATAVQWCAYLNREIAPKVPDVLCVAVPAIWTGTDEEHADGLAEAIKGWTVTAAPAPSSLAGGQATWEALDENGYAELRVNGKRITTFPSYGGAEEAAGRINAALSPEAPEREGVAVPDDVRRLVIAARNVAFDTPTQAELRALDIASEAFASRVPWDEEPEALTPRHEAPASRLTDTLNAASAKVAENPGRAAEIRENWTDGLEAPAEGAGEAMSAAERIVASAFVYEDNELFADSQTVLAALRARSSAPEAREGEVVGWMWRSQGGTIKLTTWHPDAQAENAEPLYTHPAAPSADELRIAVEALEPFAKAADKLDGLWSEDDWRWNDSVRSGVTVRDIHRARQALAALKAEG